MSLHWALLLRRRKFLVLLLAVSWSQLVCAASVEAQLDTVAGCVVISSEHWLFAALLWTWGTEVPDKCDSRPRS